MGYKIMCTAITDFIIRHNPRDIVKMAMRYESIRKINPAQFIKIYKRSIEQNEKFDDIIDELMKEYLGLGT